MMHCFNGKFYFCRLQTCGELNDPNEDVSNLLGVTQDKEPDGVIVTYPHIIKKYNLSKTEPFSVKNFEWKTRRTLTSAVIYDKSYESYIGVFANYTIRIWSPVTIDFDHVEKFKFRIPIIKVHPTDECSLVIFRNGSCATLDRSVERGNTLKPRALFGESCSIMSIGSYIRNKKQYVCYVIKDNTNNRYSILHFPLNDGVSDFNKLHTEKVRRLLHREELYVTGNAIVDNTINPAVYIIWNNSAVSKYDVVKNFWTHYGRRSSTSTLFRSEVGVVPVSKNFFFFYAKGYFPESSLILIPHINMKGYQFEILDNYWTGVKVYSFGEFVVLVESGRISLWGVHYSYKEAKRPIPVCKSRNLIL